MVLKAWRSPLAVTRVPRGGPTSARPVLLPHAANTLAVLTTDLADEAIALTAYTEDSLAIGLIPQCSQSRGLKQLFQLHSVEPPSSPNRTGEIALSLGPSTRARERVIGAMTRRLASVWRPTRTGSNSCGFM